MANTGSFKKGESGNPAGRPKASTAQAFRENPRSRKVVEKVLKVAETLGKSTLPTKIIEDLVEMRRDQIKETYSNNNGGETISAQELEDKIKAYYDELLSTLQHPDAMACAKVVMDKLIPSLKQTELDVNMEDGGWLINVRMIQPDPPSEQTKRVQG